MCVCAAAALRCFFTHTPFGIEWAGRQVLISPTEQTRTGAEIYTDCAAGGDRKMGLMCALEFIKVRCSQLHRQSKNINGSKNIL